MERQNTIGRRKAAVARVYLSKGKGNIIINDKDYKDYFPVNHLQVQMMQPLTLTETTESFDVKVTVNGGGVKGQAEAVKLGIARALVKVDENFKPTLKTNKMLTRDPRVVERKKPGRRKARKVMQFSKR